MRHYNVDTSLARRHARFYINAGVVFQLSDLETTLVVTDAAIPMADICFCTRPPSLRPLAIMLRNFSIYQASTLIDIVVTDKIDCRGRFSVKYLFLSTANSERFSILFHVDEVTTIPSLAAPFFNGAKIFASASWLEREVYDLFGLYFSEHGDLRRILTDYGFMGYPLRKDFPLTGFHEVSYNDAEGRVVSEPVELSQEFRVFHF